MMDEDIPHRWINAKSGGYKFVSSCNTHEKHAKMNIDAELSITLVTFPLSISGAASYYTETKTYFDSISSDICYEYTTGSSQLNFDKATKHLDRTSKFIDLGATHVVAQIKHGVRAYASF